LDVRLNVQRWWKLDGIKRAPGKELLAANLHLVGGGNEGESPSEDLAPLVNLDIWQTSQPVREVALAHLQRGGECGRGNGLTAHDPADNLAAEFEVLLSTARELDEAFGNDFK
jgi:hypothetical protein